MLVQSVLSLLPLLALVSAASIKGNIAFNDVLPVESLPIGSSVSLDHGLDRVLVKQDGSFEIFDVPEGIHHVETLIPGYVVQPLWVTISPPIPPIAEDGPPSLHIQSANPARQALPPSSPSLTYPIVLEALGKESYFVPKGGMNILGMLKNPMVLMMLFSGVMMYGMPKLVASMESSDPDLSKEMAETRKKMAGFQNGDWAGAISSLLAGPEEEKPAKAVKPAATPQSPQPSAPAAKSGGGKKRRK
ncbi:hypothetical protein L202_02907 [Cryptococcus amylolentus CBS 6039]|uniref:ER membrane protein complex subunit 7 beta-sandwich domain-containing protein n=1 Tax=Cryptococcus amylolentus CBS 6039 TaxID=1295533 RepID=A0A1E3HYW2_9TREE|nr:hypothetical protein L202_02907 [Cryptococcus amylolentus CBS 6039]ODN80751.1 hypothetical protein L202_02907 [Cryptococcus amylolentus CBS 6039]